MCGVDWCLAGGWSGYLLLRGRNRAGRRAYDLFWCAGLGCGGGFGRIRAEESMFISFNVEAINYIPVIGVT